MGLCQRQWYIYALLVKLHKVYSKMEFLLPLVTKDKIIRCNTLREEVNKYTESHTRKLKVVQVYICPELNLQGKSWWLWKLVVDELRGKRVNNVIIKMLANICGVHRSLSLMLEEEKFECARARKKYLDIKPIHAEMR